jgi:hypothetical protein
MKTKAFLTFMAIAAFAAAEFLSPEASARNPDDTFPGDYPEYPCGNGQTVTACTMSEDGLEWDCDAATLCNGTGSSDMSTWLEDGGVCDIEQSPSCDYSSSLQCGTFPEDFQWGDFYCPFPYLFDYPGWSCS